METLPVEIIQYIISYENLSIKDVVSFSMTNRYIYHAVRNCNSIWKKEYFKTWPQFVKLPDNKFNNCWYAEVQYIYDLKRRTPELLCEMPSRLYKVDNLLSDSDFTEWFELYQEKPRTYYYLMDDLMNIVNTNASIQGIEVLPITIPGNKTLQFYAMQVLRYLRQLHLTKEWAVFMALPPKLRTLEKGIAFVGQWFQPDSVSWMNIATDMDELTEKVKENLRMADPNHPLFDVPKEQLEMWRNENVECDKYDFLACMQIKRAMTDTLKSLFRRGHLCNIFLKVKHLREVIGSAAADSILLIIYEAVGRRLGLKHEPIVDTESLYLRSSKRNESGEYQYIDFHYCFYGREQMFLIENISAVGTTQQVIKLIAKQVLVEYDCSILPNKGTVERWYPYLKFLDLVGPFDVSVKYDLARVYMHHNMNTTSYIEVLKQQKNQAPDQIEAIINMLQQYETGRNHGGRLFRKVVPKVRPTNLKYAVGMVMKRAKRTCSCPPLCIICDWDCLASDVEPVYKVLLPHGLYLSVPQDELMVLPRIRSLSELLWWFFEDIGRHFSHRFQTVFVPNEIKEREYPEDTAVRKKYNDQVKPVF